MAGDGELIGADEPAPFELVEGRAEVPIVFVCDHASNRIPAALGDLGVAAHHLREHIAWDIGAAAVARQLQARFDAGAVFANYSRLVVDLNRSLDDRSVFPAISDGILIPANLSLDENERRRRAKALFHPYHAAIDTVIERRATGARLPVFFGIHSFTPRFHGTARPWHIGVLWDRDPRLALPMLRALRREPGLVVGDNEPYSGRHTADFSIDHHAEAMGMAHAGIEIRQDLITDSAGQERWADILARAIADVLTDPSLFTRLATH